MALPATMPQGSGWLDLIGPSGIGDGLLSMSAALLQAGQGGVPGQRTSLLGGLGAGFNALGQGAAQGQQAYQQQQFQQQRQGLLAQQLQDSQAQRAAVQQGLLAIPEGERSAYAALSPDQAGPMLVQRAQQQRDGQELSGLLGGAFGGVQPAAQPAGLLGGAGMPSRLPVGRSASTAPAQVPEGLLPIYQQAAAQAGVPVGLLVAQGQQESNFDPNAVGKAGEVGVAQIHPRTAADPGFGVPPISLADARDPTKAIPWQAQYLAARARAQGADLSTPQGQATGLRAYNGGGDPNYVQNVQRYNTSGGQSAPAQTAQAMGIDGNMLLGVAQAAARGNKQAAAILPALQSMVRTGASDYSFQNIGGTLYAINPKDPTQRMALGQAGSGAAETAIVPDTNSPTGFRYAPRDEAGRQGMAAPAPEGYRPQQPPSGYRYGAPGADGQRTLEPIPGSDADNTRQQQGQNDAQKLRQEFNALQPVKDFQAVAPQIEAIRRAQKVDNKAADLDIVFAFAKMLDPGSVVREGEADNVVKTGGIFDQLAAYANGIRGGARLTPEVRANLLAQAESRFGIFADNYDQLADRYRGLAQVNKIDPDQIAVPAVRPAQRGQPGAPTVPGTPAPQPAPAQEAAAAPATTPFGAPPPRPERGWTVLNVGRLTNEQAQNLAMKPDGLSREERAALAADLNRRANRMGAN